MELWTLSESVCSIAVFGLYRDLDWMIRDVLLHLLPPEALQSQTKTSSASSFAPRPNRLMSRESSYHQTQDPFRPILTDMFFMKLEFFFRTLQTSLKSYSWIIALVKIRAYKMISLLSEQDFWRRRCMKFLYSPYYHVLNWIQMFLCRIYASIQTKTAVFLRDSVQCTECISFTW